MSQKKEKEIFRVGMETPEVVVGLVKLHPEIELIKLQEYSPHELGVTQILQEKTDVPVQTVVRHRPDAGEYMIMLRREEVTVERLLNLVKDSTQRNKALVLCSLAITKQDEMLHFPMLDFECIVSVTNQSRVEDFVRIIGNGLILESGRSYHYYGFNLLTHSEWIKFMARALLFTGFTDCRHIGHRILSGEARLRIAKIEGSNRYLMTPKVVGIVT